MRQGAFFIALVTFMSACVIEKEGWDAVEQEDAAHLRPARVFEHKLPFVRKPQGASCKVKGQKLSSGICEKTLLCVPQGTKESTGICLLECGENAGGLLKKNAARCPSPLRCLRKKSSGHITIGMFCLPQQSERNQACEAPLDEDACASGLSCLVTSEGQNVCKEECTPEKGCSNKDEPCLMPPYARTEWQYDKHKKKVSCYADSCEKNPSTCACDAARGFFCRRAWADSEGRCGRKLGICGQI